MIIRSRNTLSDKSPKTYLTNAEVAGTNVLRWLNPNGFIASWGIQIGETGEEQTEVMLLSASTPAGTAGTLTANTLYPHPQNTPLYAIKYDQVVFERSTAGTSGVATPITSGTIGYQADGTVTTFDDTTGATTYAYKTMFRSSVLGVNTSESDWITSTGFTPYSLAALRVSGKGRVWNGKYLDDDTLNGWINEWKDVLTNSAIQVNEDYALGTVDVAFGTAGYGTITSTDFKQVKRLWVTTDGVNYYKSTKMDSNTFFPTQIFNSTLPYHYYQGDNIFGIKPDGSLGTARIQYYKLNPRMVNDTDELPTPMKGYTKSFIDYMENLALRKDGKYQESQGPLAEALSGKVSFISEITPRDKSGPEFIQIVEPISGEDY